MEKLGKFLELINIIKTLRAPGGCDWDREQNHSSLIPYLLVTYDFSVGLFDLTS